MKNVTGAEAYLELLSLRGVEYFFGNPGTDFASIVDAFAARQAQGKDLPRPITVPHEAPLVSMAHGYYLLTGRPQVAMVHVGVGTANGIGAIMNASRGRIPVLFSAGRTPLTEEGSPASRYRPIHWAQDTFDQGGMVREYVKWDYELRNPSQIESVVDRALTMAMTEPRGPVYLTLPSDLMAAPLTEVEFQKESRFDLPTLFPDPGKIEKAVEFLSGARFPLVITSSLGRSKAAVEALVELADTGAVGVVSFAPGYMNFPTKHPCHLGFMPGPLIREADVILVVDCDVPWFPNMVKPSPDTVVIQADVDPFYSRYPLRGFPSDLTIQGTPELVLRQIQAGMAVHENRDKQVLEKRRDKLAALHSETARGWEEAIHGSDDRGIKPNWLSHQIEQVMDDNTFVVNEYGNAMNPHTSQLPGSYFCLPHAGYLGWGLGAALGMKLARPEGTIIATVGDGSYLFGVPSSCHLVSETYGLPILVIIYNNQSYFAVKRATRIIHPDGWSSRTGQYPLSELPSKVHYEKICEAFGGYGEKVEDPDQVAPALERALHAVRVEKRQAVLNVICNHP